MTTIVLSGRGLVAQACLDHLRSDGRVDRILGWNARRSLGGLETVDESELRTLDGPVVVVFAGSRHDGSRIDVALDAAISCVSVADADDDLRSLFAREVIAREAGVTVVAGAGFAPGLADLLVAHGAAQFDRVDDIRVVRTGTAGPESRRTLRRARREEPHEWRRGAWRRVSRRTADRSWFPPPVGARECEPVDLGAFTLQQTWPEASIAVRAADVPSSLAFGHDDQGALRVEVWGERKGRRESVVYGAVAPVARVAGAVAAVSAIGLLGRDEGGHRIPGVHGVGRVARPTQFLEAVTHAGVVVSVFEGVSS